MNTTASLIPTLKWQAFLTCLPTNMIELNMIFNRALAPVTSFKANPLSDSNSIQTTTILLF